MGTLLSKEADKTKRTNRTKGAKRLIFYSGLPETKCGMNSTLRATEHLRGWLPTVFALFNIRSLIDAPCGDMNWMTQTDLSTLNEYIGMDFYTDHLIQAGKNISKKPLPTKYFRTLHRDILREEWPKPTQEKSAVLTRDFLQHWPLEYIPQYIERFKACGADYLITTSFSKVEENEDILFPGAFHRLNMEIEPVNWPAPRWKIDDGEDQILGLWGREDIT